MLKLELSWRGLFLLALVAAAAWALMQVYAVLITIIVAIIFMAALLPYVDWLVRRGLPRAAAVLLVLFTVILILGGLVALFVPAMVSEFQDIRDNLPRYAEDAEDLLANFGIDVELSRRAEDVDWGALISGRAAVDYGQRAFFFFLSSITVIVLTAYLLVDAPKMRTYLLRFVPRERHSDADRILEALARVVGGYIRGQVITSGVISLFTLVVLLAAGVPNAIAFAVLAGFADIIPLIGAFIAIVPAVFAAFTESTTQAVVVLVALLLYQQFEDRFLVPRVYGATLGLQPIVVLIAVLVGGELFGIPGILLALPATAAGKVALDYYLAGRDSTNAFASPPAEVAAPDEPPLSPPPRD